MTHKMSFLAITIISYLGAIVLPIIKPHSFQQLAGVEGYPYPIIVLTRSTQYFTLFAQFWLIVALISENPVAQLVAQSTGTAVFILYHGFTSVDPMSLSYHDEGMVREATRLFPPPMNRYIVGWFGLHFQHTVCPLMAWYLHGWYTWDNANRASLLGLVFLPWSLFCWKVQGIPAYPFMKRLDDTMIDTFYIWSIVFYVAMTLGIGKMFTQIE